MVVSVQESPGGWRFQTIQAGYRAEPGPIRTHNHRVDPSVFHRRAHNPMRKAVFISILDRSDTRLQKLMQWVQDLIQKQGRLNKEDVYIIADTDAARLARASTNLQKRDSLSAEELRHLHLVVTRSDSNIDQAYVNELQNRKINRPTKLSGSLKISFPQILEAIPSFLPTEKDAYKLVDNALRKFASTN